VKRGGLPIFFRGEKLTKNKVSEKSSLVMLSTVPAMASKYEDVSDWSTMLRPGDAMKHSEVCSQGAALSLFA
jgi:hypothetical protein